MKRIYKTILMLAVFGLNILGLHAQTAISTFEELDAIRDDMAGNYYLTNDIEIPAETEWLPLGMPTEWNGVNPDDLVIFSGTLDGKGYAIKGLKITSGKNFSAFIARLSGDAAVVKDLALENVDITGGMATGGLAGTLFLSKPHTNPAVLIENISVTGSIKGTTEVGGISGRSNGNPENTIKNCYVNATIEATAETNAYAGGIIGCMNTGRRITIQNVYVTGIVKTSVTTAASGNYASGLVGCISNNNAATILKVEKSVVALNTLSSESSGLIYKTKTDPFAGTVTLTGNYAKNDLGFETSSDATLASPATLLTKELYETTLEWDVENTWFVEDGSYPLLRTENLKKDATLHNLSITGAQISPVFSPEQTEYSATVSKNITSVTINAIAYDKADVEISGPGYGNSDELVVGDNTFTITVTPELEGIPEKTYTLIVTRSPSTGTGENAVAGLDIAVVNQTLCLNFEGSADIKVYTVSGNLVDSASTTDAYSIPLQSGIYIVSFNGQPYKIMMP